MKKENQYLTEDQDLIDELNSIGIASTGQAFSQQQMKVDAIQIKATLRNRKSMSDMNKSTSRYSLILVIFAMVQIVIALSQFIFDAVTSEHKWTALSLAGFMAFSIWFIFKEFDPDKILKK